MLLFYSNGGGAGRGIPIVSQSLTTTSLGLTDMEMDGLKLMELIHDIEQRSKKPFKQS